MNKYKVLTAVVLILSLNNLGLLWFLGYFSNQEIETKSVSTAPAPLTNKVDTNLALPPTSEDLGKITKTAGSSDDLSPQVVQAVQSYMQSEQFNNSMFEWQLRQRDQYDQLNKQLSNMDAQQLYDFAVNSESPNDRNYALSQLIQSGKLRQLDNEEIKLIYSQYATEQWSKSKLLATLLGKGDSEALEWAKESIKQANGRRNYGDDIFSLVYQQDPDFVAQHLNEVEFDPSSPPLEVLQFAYQEPEVAKPFFEKNFDAILRADNDDIYLYASNIPDIQLSASQQSELAEFFSSSNRNKRQFAISLAPKIRDMQLLREAYSNLTRSPDKLHLIGRMISATTNPEAMELAKELASTSDNPAIQQYARGLNN